MPAPSRQGEKPGVPRKPGEGHVGKATLHQRAPGSQHQTIAMVSEGGCDFVGPQLQYKRRIEGAKKKKTEA